MSFLSDYYNVGASNEPVRPLDEGVTVQISNAQASGDASWWDTLNDLTNKAGGYLNDIVGALVDKKVDDIKGNPDMASLTTGDPNDQPRGGVDETTKPFYVQYQKELMIGGAALLGVIVLASVLRR